MIYLCHLVLASCLLPIPTPRTFSSQGCTFQTQTNQPTVYTPPCQQWIKVISPFLCYLQKPYKGLDPHIISLWTSGSVAWGLVSPYVAPCSVMCTSCTGNQVWWTTFSIAVISQSEALLYLNNNIFKHLVLRHFTRTINCPWFYFSGHNADSLCSTQSIKCFCTV